MYTGLTASGLRIRFLVASAMRAAHAAEEAKDAGLEHRLEEKLEAKMHQLLAFKMVEMENKLGAESKQSAALEARLEEKLQAAVHQVIAFKMVELESKFVSRIAALEATIAVARDGGLAPTPLHSAPLQGVAQAQTAEEIPEPDMLPHDYVVLAKEPRKARAEEFEVEDDEESCSSPTKEYDFITGKLKEKGKDAPGLETPVASPRAAEEGITYDEALEKLGGDKTLEMHRSMSEALSAEVRDADLEKELTEAVPGSHEDRRGFSRQLVNQRFVESIEELYEDAEAAHPVFEKTIQDLAAESSAKAIVGPIKAKTRARMKALYKYRDAEGDGIAYYRLTDLVRATLQFADFDAMYAGLATVVAKLGGRVRELNDRYLDPLGDYRDIQMVVEESGHLCELQLSTEPYLRAKKTTGHRDFSVVRELQAAVADGDMDRVDTALQWGRENAGVVRDLTHLHDAPAAMAKSRSEKHLTADLRELFETGAARLLLHEAAAHDHVEIAARLLNHGADGDVTAPDDVGDTPLHLAVRRGSERMVWALLDVGRVRVDVENKQGVTALVVGLAMLRRRLPEAKARAVSTLARFAGAEAVKVARLKVDTYVKDYLTHKSRALVDAAFEGNVAECEALLSDFADAASEDPLGNTALALACDKLDDKLIALLLDWKADLNVFPRASCVCPLYAACRAELARRNDRPDLTSDADVKKLDWPLAEKLIVAHGADPAYALPAACRDGAVTILAWLLLDKPAAKKLDKPVKYRDVHKKDVDGAVIPKLAGKLEPLDALLKKDDDDARKSAITAHDPAHEHAWKDAKKRRAVATNRAKKAIVEELMRDRDGASPVDFLGADRFDEHKYMLWGKVLDADKTGILKANVKPDLVYDFQPGDLVIADVAFNAVKNRAAKG